MAITTRKPRRTTAPHIISRVQQPTTGAVRPKPVAAAAPKAPAVVAAPKPVAPVQQALPEFIPPPPVVLPSGTSDRLTAREQFGGAVGSTNRGLRTLAQQLGGLSSVGQYGYAAGADPRGFGTLSSSQLAIDPNDPNSAMATIARNLGKNLQFVGDTNENRNTWTSGLRLTEEDEQRTSANNAKTKAVQDYETARLDLVDQLTGNAGAFGSLKGIIRGANAADDAATAAAIAQAQAQAAAAPPPPPAAAPAAPAPAAKPLFKTVQGVAGNYFGEWHIYPDGHKVFVKKMPWSSVG
jgi:hypothetical protein